jgi:hypothetical protein
MIIPEGTRPRSTELQGVSLAAGMKEGPLGAEFDVSKKLSFSIHITFSITRVLV